MELYNRVHVARYILLYVGLYVSVLGLTFTSSATVCTRTHTVLHEIPLSFDDLSHPTWFSRALYACMDAWAQIRLDSGNVSCIDQEDFVRIIGDLAYANFCVEQVCRTYGQDYVEDRSDADYLKRVIGMIMVAVDTCCGHVPEQEKRTCIQYLGKQLCVSLDGLL